MKKFTLLFFVLAIFTIVINPIAYKRITLQLENVDKGNYQLALFSSIGQRVATKNIYARGGSSTEIFEVSISIKFSVGCSYSSV